MRLRNAYSRLTLSQKIVVPFLLLFLGMSLAGTVLFGYWYSHDLEASQNGEVESLSTLVLRNFQEAGENLRLQAKLTGDSDAVRSLTSARDLVGLTQIMLPMKQTLGVDAVKLVDADGATLVDLRRDEDIGEILRDESAIEHALSGVYLSDVVALEGKFKSYLVGLSPIKSADGRVGAVFFGMLVGDDLLKKMSSGTDQELAAFHEGHIIASTLPGARLDPGKLFLNQAEPGRVSIGNSEYIAKSAALDARDSKTGLTVVVLRPTEAADTARRDFWLRLGGYYLVGALIAAIVGAIISRTIAHPLRTLIGVTKRLAGGDLMARADVGSFDEVGDLGQAFNVMAEQIHERDQRLSSALLELEQRNLTLEESHGQLRRLQEVSATLAGNPDSDELRALVAATSLDVLEGNSAWILGVGGNGQWLEGRTVYTREQTDPTVLPALFGLDGVATLSLAAHSNLLTRVASQKEPAFIDDIAQLTSEEAKAIFGRQQAAPSLIRALAVLPAVFKDEALALVVVAKDRPEPFTEQQRTTAIAFISYASVATKSLRLYRELKRMSEIDALTEIFNPRAVQELLWREIQRSQRNGRPLSILMLDVDNFKLFNDTYGHLRGDAVLKQVASVLKSCCRGMDFVGRYGGDEFVVLLPETASAEAETVAHRILGRLAAEAVSVGGEYDLPIACSIGIATYPEHGTEQQDLVHAADVAMYEAKRSGGNMALKADFGSAQASAQDGSTWSMLDGFIAAVDNKDHYTRCHSELVTKWALGAAEELHLPASIHDQIRIAGILHDVGKIGVPAHILQKPGPLTRDERQIVEQHPLFGTLLVQHVPNSEHILDAVRHHHERYDGDGYPYRLKGKEIPLLARLLAVADAYSAMVTDRPYRKALTWRQAVAELETHAGSQFDPEVVQAFVCRAKRVMTRDELAEPTARADNWASWVSWPHASVLKLP